MKLIIGLGNPGKKYAHTRHNAGFMLVDELQKEWNFPNFELNKKFDAEMTEGIYSSVIPSAVEGSRSNTASEIKILLAKPATYMNNSGEAVKKIMDFYKISPADLIVIHDDLDIDLGKYKISADSRAAGHNGVQSIINALGTQKFKRIRIGIEGEEKRKNRLMPSDEFVLQNFTEKETEKINKTLVEIIKNMLSFL